VSPFVKFVKISKLLFFPQRIYHVFYFQKVFLQKHSNFFEEKNVKETKKNGIKPKLLLFFPFDQNKIYLLKF
jgi:hypothetical protein